MPDDFADFGFVTDDKAMQAILAKKSTGTPLKSKAIAELWDDAAKSKAFFSARVTSADILEGLRSQINHVVSGQASTEEAVWWMKRFLESKGDSALKDMGFATVEEAKATNSLAELGSHRRLTLIVEQNVAMARSAREWQQMQEDADIVPFVQYHTREDGSVRNSHALLNKKVFRKDDPALKRIFPPQDFRCRCRLDELDEDDAAGLPIQHGLPDGWEPPESGYSFDPEAWAAQGQDARDKWGEDLVEPFKADSMAHGQGRIEALQNNRAVMADLAKNSTDTRQKAEAAKAVDSLDQRISQVQADMQAKQNAKQAERKASLEIEKTSNRVKINETTEPTGAADPMKAPTTCFSTEDTPSLIEDKRRLRSIGYPDKETLAFVEGNYRKDAYIKILQGMDNTYLVIPSTSGENIIPDLLADRLSEDFGGRVLKGYAENTSDNESKNKPGYIKKMIDPTDFILNLDVLSKHRGSNIVVVDDILTTGETVEAMLNALAKVGMSSTAVAVLGARFGGLPLQAETARRLASEISSKLELDEEEVYNTIVKAHRRGYDNLIAKAVHEAKSKPKAERIYGIVSKKARSIRGDMEPREGAPSDSKP